LYNYIKAIIITTNLFCLLLKNDVILGKVVVGNKAPTKVGERRWKGRKGEEEWLPNVFPLHLLSPTFLS